MKRRTFISGMTFGLLTAPLTVEAPPAGEVFQIGYESTPSPSSRES